VFSRQSAGTNQLIRENTAKLVATPEQLLEELNLAGAGGQFVLAPATQRAAASARPAPEQDRSTTPDEGKILHHLQDGPRHVDEIARGAAMPVASVTATLTMLELRGLVVQERPLVYTRA
jgi:DNA processing protein